MDNTLKLILVAAALTCALLAVLVHIEPCSTDAECGCTTDCLE